MLTGSLNPIPSQFSLSPLYNIYEIPQLPCLMDLSRWIDLEFECMIAADCEGTDYTTSHRTWFHFCVVGGLPGATISIHLINMNKQVHQSHGAQEGIALWSRDGGF